MTDHSAYRPGPVPAAAGVGLKGPHYREILDTRPAVGWFEVHPENYMGAGGAPHAYLSAVRDCYPLSFHGVGLSLGGVGPLDADHLARWVSLVDRYEPALVSEHLAWSAFDGAFLNDLLPLPLTDEALDLMVDHVDQMQTALGRQVLIENPSTYLLTEQDTMSEPDFLRALAKRSGCGLLLDVNNVYVSCSNHGMDPGAYVAAFPLTFVKEIHLAGHATETHGTAELRIDDHGSPVCDDVWALFDRVLVETGPVPSLIEWDTDVPEWAVLKKEADRAQHYLNVHDLVLGRRHGDAGFA